MRTTGKDGVRWSPLEVMSPLHIVGLLKVVGPPWAVWGFSDKRHVQHMRRGRLVLTAVELRPYVERVELLDVGAFRKLPVFSFFELRGDVGAVFAPLQPVSSGVPTGESD